MRRDCREVIKPISSYHHIMAVHLETTLNGMWYLAGSWWGDRKHGMTVSCSDNEVWKMLSIYASEDSEGFVFLKYNY